MTSMKDVAQRAGVSVSTVSHVINETRNVNPETKEKVLRAIKEFHYNVNPIARTLRSGSSKLIGVVVSNLANTFFMDIALSIDKVLSKEGYYLIYMNSNENKDVERENIEKLLMQNVDGLVIAPVGQDCMYLEELIQGKCPSVFFDRKPEGFETDCILTTNYEGALSGTKLLIDRGHQKIGFIGSHFDKTMEERINGYRGALMKSGIQINEDLITTGSEGSLTLEDIIQGEGYSLTRYLVEEKKITALFCGNELAAIAAISFLKNNNYKLKDDVEVVSFDNAFWLSITSPGISAVEQDRELIGKKAAEVLLDRINENNSPMKVIRVPTKLVIR